MESDDIMNHFSFTKDGHAPATIGAKAGPTASPLLNWKIDELGRLIITDGDSINYPPLEMIKKSNNAVWGRTPDGKKFKFIILES